MVVAERTAAMRCGLIAALSQAKAKLVSEALLADIKARDTHLTVGARGCENLDLDTPGVLCLNDIDIM